LFFLFALAFVLSLVRTHFRHDFFSASLGIGLGERQRELTTCRDRADGRRETQTKCAAIV